MSDETFTDGPHFDEDVYYFAVDSGRAGYVAVINLTGQSLCFSVHGGRSQNIASMSRVPTIKQGRVMHLDALGALSHSDFPNIGHKQCVAAWSIVDPVVAKHLRRDFDANQTVTYDDRGRLVRRDGTTSRALSRLFLTVQPVDDEADAMLEEIKGSPHTAVHTV